MFRIPFMLSCAAVLLITNVQAETIEAFTEPYQEVKLAAGDSGIIAEVLVTPGDKTKEGQLLVSLDNRVLQATLAVANQKSASRGLIDVAEAELQLRKDRLNQILTLRQRGHATQRELSRAEADVTIGEAKLRQATDELRLRQLEVRRIEAQIAQRQIASPFAGIVTEQHRRVGEPTLISDPRILTLSQLDRLRVKFSVAPQQAEQLGEQQNVQIVMTGTNKRVQAQIERVGKTIDAKSGTVEVLATIGNEDQKLRSGARCLLELASVHAASSNQPNSDHSSTKTLETTILRRN